MKTYLRYSISVTSKQYPYKAPVEVERVSQELFLKCKKYSLEDHTRLILVPIDAPEYDLIMKFKSDYPEYASQFPIYEHKFTAKEINAAEYFLLKSTSIILPKLDSVSFSKCCSEKTLAGAQVGNFRIGKNDFRNKTISGTSAYRFFISLQAKSKLEEAKVTNFNYIPVYATKNPDPVAYQIEAESLLPPLEPYNNWGVYKRCDNCGKIISNSIHKLPNPFTVPRDYLNNLKDFNATSEVFTEIVARQYIISKKVYNLLRSLGAKKLACEPIHFVDR